MAFRQCQFRLARQWRRGQECRVASIASRHQSAMPLAGDAIEDYAGDLTSADRGRQSRAPTPRPIVPGRETSSTSTTGKPKCAASSAVAPRGPGARHAVEQAHDAFDHEDVCAVRRPRRQARRANAGGIAQLSRLTLGVAGGGGMKGGIDIIRAAFRRAARRGRVARSARQQASVTVVLPAPECGAAMINPRAVMSCAFTPHLRESGGDSRRRRARCRENPPLPARGRRRSAPCVRSSPPRPCRDRRRACRE